MPEKLQKQSFEVRAQQDFLAYSEDLLRPRAERTCTDLVFAVFFVLLAAGFLTVGAYFIYQVVSRPELLAAANQPPYLASYMNMGILQRAVSYLLAMMGVTLLLAVLMMWMLQCCTSFTCVLLAVFGFASLAIFVVMNFVRGQIVCGMATSAFTIILGVFAYCYRRQLTAMVVLLRTVGIFLKARPLVLLFPILGVLTIIAMTIFWVVSLYAGLLLYNQGLITNQIFIGVCATWIFIASYNTLVFFYAFGFLVAAEAGLWFYQSQLSSIGTPICWLIKQLGTTSLAALLVVFIKFLQTILSLASSRRRVRGMAAIAIAFCICMTSCLLRHLQYLLQILNGYSMAVSAITGLSYLQSAYASGTLLLNNAESFGVLTISTYFLRLSGVLACSVIPTAASYTILELLAFDNTLITIGSFVVFFYTAVISLVMLSTTTESMSAIFVFYSLEYEMQAIGRAVEICNAKEKLELCYSTGFSEQFAPIGKERVRAQSQISQEPAQQEEETPVKRSSMIQNHHHNLHHGQQKGGGHHHEHHHHERPSKAEVPKLVAYRPSVTPRQVDLPINKDRHSLA